MFLYCSEEQVVRGADVPAHNPATNLISTREFLMKFPSIQDHMSPHAKTAFSRSVAPHCTQQTVFDMTCVTFQMLEFSYPK